MAEVMTENSDELSKSTLKKSPNFYHLTSLRLGCEVRGIDLKEEVSKQAINAIKEEITKHRILIFKNQGLISGARLEEIAKWFGELDGPFDNHPRAPPRDIFRIDTDEIIEETTRTTSSWYVEQSYMKLLNSYTFCHIVSDSNDAHTSFVGSTEIVEGLSRAKRNRWEKLYMISDRHERPIHPLIFTHPESKKVSLCYNALMIAAFIWNYGDDNARITDPKETAQIIEEINQEYNKQETIYQHKWKEGELLMIDNLSVGLNAPYENMLDNNDKGLAVLHRISTRGTYRPTKQYKWVDE